MANNQTEFKPSTIRIVAVAFVAVITLINIYSLVKQGGPHSSEDYLAIVLNIGCVVMSVVIIRNEKKRKEKYEEMEKQRIEKKQRRRNNKKK
ncbi:MAG: hypothetical protein ACOX7J_05890 [Bacillota bacterium]|jgi:amino acid permease